MWQLRLVLVLEQDISTRRGHHAYDAATILGCEGVMWLAKNAADHTLQDLRHTGIRSFARVRAVRRLRTSWSRPYRANSRAAFCCSVMLDSCPESRILCDCSLIICFKLCGYASPLMLRPLAGESSSMWMSIDHLRPHAATHGAIAGLAHPQLLPPNPHAPLAAAAPQHHPGYITTR